MSGADADADARELLRAVWVRQRGRVLERVAVIEAAVGDGTPDAQARETARVEAHKLAGSVGTFGYWQASALARDIELALEDRARRPGSLPERAAALRRALEGEPER